MPTTISDTTARITARITHIIARTPVLPTAIVGRSLADMDRPGNFDAFWLFYLREHGKASTRALHYIGTTLVFVVAAVAIVTQTWWLLWAMPLAGYLFAWVAHFAVEKNRPATFKHPFWSLIGDFRMYFLWLSGRLGPHLARAGVGVRSPHIVGHDAPPLDPRPVADPRRG